MLLKVKIVEEAAFYMVHLNNEDKKRRIKTQEDKEGSGAQVVLLLEP